MCGYVLCVVVVCFVCVGVCCFVWFVPFSCVLRLCWMKVVCGCVCFVFCDLRCLVCFGIRRVLFCLRGMFYYVYAWLAVFDLRLICVLRLTSV